MQRVLICAESIRLLWGHRAGGPMWKLTVNSPNMQVAYCRAESVLVGNLRWRVSYSLGSVYPAHSLGGKMMSEIEIHCSEAGSLNRRPASGTADRPSRSWQRVQVVERSRRRTRQYPNSWSKTLPSWCAMAADEEAVCRVFRAESASPLSTE